MLSIRIETATIKYGSDQSFEVSGITFDTVAQLVVTGERAELGAVIGKVQSFLEKAKANETTDIRGELGSVIAQVPTLAAKVIALSIDPDDKEGWRQTRRLPMTVQLDALLAIGRLTFDGEDSIKNFVGGLSRLMKGVTKASTTLNSTELAQIGTNS